MRFRGKALLTGAVHFVDISNEISGKVLRSDIESLLTHRQRRWSLKSEIFGPIV